MANNIVFEIVEHIGTISENDRGWTKELNIVSWNGGTPKYDIREWNSGHERMGKGLTLTEDEMRKIADLYMSKREGIASKHENIIII